MIDEVVRKIQRENEAMTLKRMMDKKATKEQVEEFKKSQEVWTKLEDDKIRRENEEIAKFSQRKEMWREEVDREQRQRRELKNESVLKLAGEMRKRALRSSWRWRMSSKGGFYSGRGTSWQQSSGGRGRRGRRRRTSTTGRSCSPSSPRTTRLTR